jgi:hypothetical protein
MGKSRAASKNAKRRAKKKENKAEAKKDENVASNDAPMDVSKAASTPAIEYIVEEMPDDAAFAEVFKRFAPQADEAPASSEVRTSLGYPGAWLSCLCLLVLRCSINIPHTPPLDPPPRPL